MKRHIVHLRVEIYEPKKKESNKDVLAAEKALLDSAIKGFKVAMDPYSKSKSIVVLDLDCPVQTFTKAFFVDIDDKNEDTLYKNKEIIRKSGFVDTLEPDYGTVEAVKEKKSVNRFLK